MRPISSGAWSAGTLFAALWAAIAIASLSTERGPANPFVFFEPSVLLSAGDRAEVDRGQALTRVLSGAGHEVAIFAAVRVNADGDRLVAWVRNIAALKRSAFVRAIGQFSDPPRLEDLSSLSLDDEDLEEIRRCRPGRCSLKLAAPEMEELQRAVAGARRDWKQALQDAFRRLVLRRVQMYRSSGHAANQQYHDHDARVSLQQTFSSIIARSQNLTRHLPGFAEYLDRYPAVSAPDVESFIYWSKEQFGGKVVVSATHVSILRRARPMPDALVAGKQVFATHYMNGSLALTAIVRGQPGSYNYLGYLNRSEVDVVGGLFGGLARLIVERRLEAEASDVLEGLRERLERGDPPVETTVG